MSILAMNRSRIRSRCYLKSWFKVTSSIEPNPYAPSAIISESPPREPRLGRSGWLRALLVLQGLVIIVSLAVEAYEHESIVGSGPVFSLVGLTIAVVAFRNQQPYAMAYGLSAAAFALLIVFLINYNHWGPPQGDRPITILAYCYASVALPVTWWLLTKRMKLG